MDSRRYSRIALATVLSFLLGLSHAQAAQALNGDIINRFIDSLVALQPLQEKYQGESWASAANSTGDESGDGISLMSDSLEAMKGHEAYAEVARTVKAHGFSSPEQWGEIGDRIFKAYAAASMEAERPGSRREMEEAMRELENADMPAAQKQMMQQSMGQAMATIKSLTDAPQADIEAVQPYMAEIEQAFVAENGPAGEDSRP